MAIVMMVVTGRSTTIVLREPIVPIAAKESMHPYCDRLLRVCPLNRHLRGPHPQPVSRHLVGMDMELVQHTSMLSHATSSLVPAAAAGGAARQRLRPQAHPLHLHTLVHPQSHLLVHPT